MFDIGFTEIMIIGLVALIVIGPSRLPEAMRSTAMWIGRAKRMMGNVRRDLENEIGIDEIRQDLRNEKIMEGLKADALEDEKERLAKQARENQKAESQKPELQKPELQKQSPRGNSYLDSVHKNGTPGNDNAAPETASEPDQPQPKENNN